MTHRELSQKILNEIHTANGVVSVIYKDFDTGAIPFQFAPNYVMQAADMAKIPILLAAMKRIDEGQLSLENCVLVPELWITANSQAFERGVMSYSIDELLGWMIVANEDTAANVLIEAMGFSYINDCCAAFGLNHTQVKSYLGESKLPGDKYSNVTCVQDMLTFFEMLYRNQGLSRRLCEYAGRLLLRQRTYHGFMRYICDDIYFGGKTGESERESHEAGVFYLKYVDYFLGIFCADTSDAPQQKLAAQRLRGRIANMIYNYYLEREDAIHRLPYAPNRGRRSNGRD